MTRMSDCENAVLKYFFNAFACDKINSNHKMYLKLLNSLKHMFKILNSLNVNQNSLNMKMCEI